MGLGIGLGDRVGDGDGGGDGDRDGARVSNGDIPFMRWSALATAPPGATGGRVGGGDARLAPAAAAGNKYEVANRAESGPDADLYDGPPELPESVFSGSSSQYSSMPLHGTPSRTIWRALQISTWPFAPTRV